MDLSIKSCGKSIEIRYSDLISCRRENAILRHLRTCWRRNSVASFDSTFSPVTWRLEKKLRDGYVGFFMYLHLVCSLFSPSRLGEK